jgi:Anti-sigma-K factor rskA
MAENGPQNQPDEALVDLAIKQATEGLSPAEQRLLDALDGEAVSLARRDIERAAAAVMLAAKTDAEPLPQALAQKLAQQAEAHFAQSAATKITDLGAARAQREAAPPRRSSRSGVMGWLAAAACLVLALFGWLRTAPSGEPVVQTVPETPVPPVVAPVLPPTPAEERAALMAKADSLKITLSATKDPAASGVSGDVVWDPETQKGYFHFVGLARNDPKVHQYQIWIFDAGRDKRYPVDGGVFDVPADSNEIIIPIRAALAVLKPAAFAVTVEKPGGVVVSAKDHVVVLGAPG